MFINILPGKICIPPGDKMYPSPPLETVWKKGKNSDFGANRAELVVITYCGQGRVISTSLSKKGKVFSPFLVPLDGRERDHRYSWLVLGTDLNKGLFSLDSISFHPWPWLQWDCEWEGWLAQGARGGNKCAVWGEEVWGWTGWGHPCLVSAWPGPHPGRCAVAQYRP